MAAPEPAARAQPEAIVVGAGAAGLAGAAMLGRCGVSALVLERGERPGQSWHRRYDDLRLNTVRWMSSLPGYVMERRYGHWPRREHWAAYLARYADRQGVRVRTGVEVRRVDREADGWRLSTSDGDLRARIVVIATGLDHTPRMPAWPGAEAFTGALVHSADFRNPGPYAGLDMVVVGGGNSATEIAALLAGGGARTVRIAIRTPPLLLRPRHLGVSITFLGVPGRLLPDRLLDALSFRMHRRTVGALRHTVFPQPPRGISAQRRTGYVAPVDRGFVDAVRRGAVEVVPALERFDGGEVVLEGGRRLRADAVIAATGYSTGLHRLVGHLGVLGPDERPRVHGGSSPPGAPGLFFTGYHYTLIPTLPHLGMEARGVARAVARAAAA